MQETLNYFDSLENETRDKCAEKYRALILLSESHQSIDWLSINNKIIARWSMSGLLYIKKKAFVRKTANGRTWITAKNRKLEYDVFMINMRDFWGTCRAGFSDYGEAKAHSEYLKLHCG